eukprot:scaffold2858_cov659-Pavlova_lutheri.AAC.85
MGTEGKRIQGHVPVTSHPCAEGDGQTTAASLNDRTRPPQIKWVAAPRERKPRHPGLPSGLGNTRDGWSRPGHVPHE